MGRQALRHQVGGVLLANWAEGGGGGGAVSSVALEPFQGLACLHLLVSFSPCSGGDSRPQSPPKNLHCLPASLALL